MTSEVDGSPEAKAANLNKIKKNLKKASSRGAEVACLPEMCSVGYDLQKLDGKLVGLAETFQEDTLTVSPFLAEIAECARQLSLAVIIPVPEVEPITKYSYEQGQDGFPTTRAYSSAFVFDNTGRLLGRHRKVHTQVWAPEGTYKNYRDDKVLAMGGDANTFELHLPEGRSLSFGVILGADLEYSHFERNTTAPRFADKVYKEEGDLVRTMAQVWGVQCIFCGMAETGDRWLAQARLAATNGTIGGLMVCAANQVGNGFSGQSCIYNGREMAFDKKAVLVGQLPAGEEDLLVVRLPLHI